AEALFTLSRRVLAPFALGYFSSQFLVDEAELSCSLNDTPLELLVEQGFGSVRRFGIRPRDLLAVESMVKGGHERCVAEGDLGLRDDALKEKSLERCGEARTPRRSNDEAGVPCQLERYPGRAQGLPSGRVRENEDVVRFGVRSFVRQDPCYLATAAAEIWSSLHANRLEQTAPGRVRRPDVGQIETQHARQHLEQCFPDISRVPAAPHRRQRQNRGEVAELSTKGHQMMRWLERRAAAFRGCFHCGPVRSAHARIHLVERRWGSPAQRRRARQWGETCG